MFHRSLSVPGVHKRVISELLRPRQWKPSLDDRNFMLQVWCVGWGGVAAAVHGEGRLWQWKPSLDGRHFMLQVWCVEWGGCCRAWGGAAVAVRVEGGLLLGGVQARICSYSLPFTSGCCSCAVCVLASCDQRCAGY